MTLVHYCLVQLVQLVTKRVCCSGLGNAASLAPVAAQPEGEAQNSPPQVTQSRGTNANELAEDTAANAEPSSAHKNGKRRRGGRVRHSHALCMMSAAACRHCMSSLSCAMRACKSPLQCTYIITDAGAPVRLCLLITASSNCTHECHVATISLHWECDE